MSSLKKEGLLKILPKNGPSSEEVKKYLDKYNDEFIVIKCGGSVLINPSLFNVFIQDVAVLKKLGLSPIIVHGGGKRINNKLSELNIKSHFIKGLRVTDVKTINIVEDVLIEFNKEIVNALKYHSCEAKRITSKEHNIISVKPESKDLGFVGIPNKIKTNVLNEIIKTNRVPVIAPLGINENNQTFNINADTAAGAIAKELKSRRLLLMTDIEGVIDSNNNLVTEITPETANKMIEDEIVKGGMIPKINTCIDAVNNGVRGVVIIDGRKPHSILFELFSDKGAGTLIRK
jgi:acetylglutamate kinase